MLNSTIEDMLVSKGVDTFYVGTHGSFDLLVLSALRNMKNRYPYILYSVVLAHMPGVINEHSYYEAFETLYPDGLERVPRRFAISHRNRWMVEQSQYLIAFVQHGWGGAAQTLKYAKTKGLNITNLSNYEGDIAGHDNNLIAKQGI
jgi:hypothetical protein